MQNKTHCAYVPRPRRVEYIENVNGRQLDRGQGESRVDGQGCHSNFSQGTNPIDFNQFLKLLHEGETGGRGGGAGAGAGKVSTCPVANKEKKRKIAKNQLKKFCLRSGKSHAHQRPSSLLACLYIHTRASRQEN